MAMGIGQAMVRNKPHQGQPKQPKQKGGFNPLKVLKGLETGSLLTPEQMQAAARALTVLETKPEIHGYAEIAKQLTGEKTREAGGLENLGTRTAGNVSGLYKGLAESAAQSIANQKAMAGSLSTQAAGIAKQGTENLGQLQTGALGDYQKQLEMRGAQDTAGGAQQALSQAVSAQQGYQQLQSQSAEQGAQEQGSSSTALLAAMAGSGQIQGAEAGAGIKRDVANRVAESNAKYNQNIQTAKSKQAEAKASYGSKLVKNLLGLREGEQKFKTAEQAVAGEKAKAGVEAEERAEGRTQQEIENGRADRKEEREVGKEGRESALNWKEFGLAQWKAHHPNAGEQGKKTKEVNEEVKEVKSQMGSIIGSLGAPPKNVSPQKVLDTYLKEVNSKSSADPRIVKKVVENWFWGPHRQKEREDSGVGTGHR